MRLALHIPGSNGPAPLVLVLLDGDGREAERGHLEVDGESVKFVKTGVPRPPRTHASLARDRGKGTYA